MKKFITDFFNYQHIQTEDFSVITHAEHLHSYYEILYFLNGEADYIINGFIYHLKKRDFLLIRPGEYHRLVPNESKKYERICIHFNTKGIAENLREQIDSFKSICHVHKYSAIDNIFASLLEAEYDGNYTEEDILLLIERNLDVILTHLRYLQKETDIAPISTNQQINDILDYIDKNITKPINIDTISKEFFKSASSIAHNFSSVMKMPIQQYVTSKKIVYAQRLIQQGDLPTAVAAQLSFKDYSTFFKAYKRVLGKSPVEDSASNKKNRDSKIFNT